MQPCQPLQVTLPSLHYSRLVILGCPLLSVTRLHHLRTYYRHLESPSDKCPAGRSVHAHLSRHAHLLSDANGYWKRWGLPLQKQRRVYATCVSSWRCQSSEGYFSQTVSIVYHIVFTDIQHRRAGTTPADSSTLPASREAWASPLANRPINRMRAPLPPVHAWKLLVPSASGDQTQAHLHYSTLISAQHTTPTDPDIGLPHPPPVVQIRQSLGILQSAH